MMLGWTRRWEDAQAQSFVLLSDSTGFWDCAHVPLSLCALCGSVVCALRRFLFVFHYSYSLSRVPSTRCHEESEAAEKKRTIALSQQEKGEQRASLPLFPCVEHADLRVYVCVCVYVCLRVPLANRVSGAQTT